MRLDDYHHFLYLYVSFCDDYVNPMYMVFDEDDQHAQPETVHVPRSNVEDQVAKGARQGYNGEEEDEYKATLPAG